MHIGGGTSMAVGEINVFFSFLRIQLIFSGPSKISRIWLCYQGRKLDKSVTDIQHLDDDVTLTTVEQLIERNLFPAQYSVRLEIDDSEVEVKCSQLVDLERAAYQKSTLSSLRTLIEEWRRDNDGRSPVILDVGGGPRSGMTMKRELENCTVQILDIVAGPEVDFVADVHLMSDHVAPESVDFVCSVSTFEHLLMPWKAAVEINKVLKPEGLAFIVSHQTIGIHDQPNDHFRFSDTAWGGLFNEATGFEIVQTFMQDFVRLAPMHYFSVFEGFEKAGGFTESAVIARKTGTCRVDWPTHVYERRKIDYVY